MKKRMFLSLVVMVLTMSLAFSTVAFAASDGRITATVNGLPVNLAGTDAGDLWAQLSARVGVATQLLADTPHSVASDTINPVDEQRVGYAAQVPAGQWGATSAAHTMLQNAINAAVLILENQFSPGEEFDLTIGMEGNVGFAGLIMQIGLPVQLELADFSDNRNFFDAGFTSPPPPTGWFAEYFTLAAGEMPVRRNRDVPVVMPEGNYNFYHVGWAGRPDNFSGSGDFFTARVRVLPGTALGSLPPITLALANAIAPYNDPPTNLALQNLQIALPCGTVGSGHDHIIPLVSVTVVP